MDYLKAEQLSSAKWRVLSVPFGGPFAGKDLDGEWFSERTNVIGPYKHLNERPVVFHHAKDEELDDEVIGTGDNLVRESDGHWLTLWLDRSNRYWERVSKLLSQGRMFGSSGSIPQFVKFAKDERGRRTGEILQWPVLEQTLTPTPSNFFSRVVPAKAIDHFILAGIDVEPYKALFDEPDLGSPTADLPRDLGASAPGDAAAMRERLLGSIRVLDAKAEAFKNLR